MSKILNIEIQNNSRKNILDKFSEMVTNPSKNSPMKHIVSLNPENMVVAQSDEEFRLVLQSADLQLVDGVGMVLASKLLGQKISERYTGVDFMNDSIVKVSNGSSRVLFLGGSPGLAVDLASCYQEKYPKLTFKGVTGIKNIKDGQTALERVELIKEVHAYKPHIIFASFGSPYQELWLWRNRAELNGIICCGVGGAFDFAAGKVMRAPAWIRAIGMEWLFRLILQPWRLQRQLRLVTFLMLVFKQKFSK